MSSLFDVNQVPNELFQPLPPHFSYGVVPSETRSYSGQNVFDWFADKVVRLYPVDRYGRYTTVDVIIGVPKGLRNVERITDRGTRKQCVLTLEHLSTEEIGDAHHVFRRTGRSLALDANAPYAVEFFGEATIEGHSYVTHGIPTFM